MSPGQSSLHSLTLIQLRSFLADPGVPWQGRIRRDQAGSSVFPVPFPWDHREWEATDPPGEIPGIRPCSRLSGASPVFPVPGAGIPSPAAPGVVFLPGTRSGKCREGGDGAVVLAGRAWNSPGCEIPPVPTVVFPVPWIPPHSYPGNVLAFPDFPGVSKSRCSIPVLFSLWVFQVGT